MLARAAATAPMRAEYDARNSKGKSKRPAGVACGNHGAVAKTQDKGHTIMISGTPSNTMSNDSGAPKRA